MTRARPPSTAGCVFVIIFVIVIVAAVAFFLYGAVQGAGKIMGGD